MSEEKKSLFDNDLWREASRAFNEAMDEDERMQEEWWNSLSAEQRINAFCCVTRRIHRGDVVERGSYRYVLYDVCGFGPEAYIAAQCAGYLDIHNLIWSGIEAEERTHSVADDRETLQQFLDERSES